MPKIQRSKLESMFGPNWHENLPPGTPRSEEINISDAEASQLIRMANALGTTPEVVQQQLSPGKEQRPYTKAPPSAQALAQAGYRPAQQNRSSNETDPRLTGLIEAVYKKLEGSSRTIKAAEFRPDPFGGHYIIHVETSRMVEQRVVDTSTGEVLPKGAVRPGQGGPYKDIGPGEINEIIPQSSLKVGLVQGQPVVGVVGSGAYYSLKHPSVRKSGPADLTDALTTAVQNVQVSRLNEPVQNIVQALNLTSQNWSTVSAGLQYMTPAGRGAMLSRYSGKPEQGTQHFDPDLAGVRSKGSTLPFSSVHMQIPGNIQSGRRLMLGGEGIGKDTKRARLELREYSPAGPSRGQPHPEVQANLMWGGMRERETAIPGRGIFFTEQVFPEGQGAVSPNFLKYVTESFQDNPTKFRIPLLGGFSEEDIAKSLGLVDDQGQRRSRRVGSGQKVQAYPGHLGQDVAENFESATITGFEVILDQNAKGDWNRYVQLQGHRDTDIGGSAANKFGGMKALTTSFDPAAMGLPQGTQAAFNAPSSSRHFMANVLNYMPRDELETYWGMVHKGAKPPEIINTPETFRQAAKVYGRYLKDHYREDTIFKTVTKHEMERLRDTIGDRLKTVRAAGTTTTGEELFKVTFTSGGYDLPFGSKLVRESSSQENVKMSFEEGDFYRQMGMPEVWQKVRAEGGHYRAPHEAIAEAMALNAGKSITANRPVFDIDKLAAAPDFQKQWAAMLNIKREELTPPDFERSLEGLSGKSKAYQVAMLENAIKAGTLQEFFGEDALFKVRGQYVAGPGLLGRFSFTDIENNQEYRALQRSTQDLLTGAIGGLRDLNPGKVLAEQAGILDTRGGREEWLSARTKRGIEGTYASLDAVGTNEAATSYKALSDMFGLKEFGIDYRTPEGRKAIDDLSRSGQLLETGMRNPTSNPRQTAGLVRNFITENILRERGLNMRLGTSRTIYNNPAWVWSQGGDNDSDRLRSFAVTLFNKDKGIRNLLQLSSVDDILKAARENPAGEMQDYLKKLKKSNRSKFFNMGTSRQSHDPDQVMADSTKKMELLSEQTGTTYNFFRRMLPVLAEITHPQQQNLIGLASAKYFQPLIDQKEYGTNTPEAQFISFLGSYQGFRGSSSLPGGGYAPKSMTESAAFDHLIGIMGRFYDPKSKDRSDPLIAQMVAAMVASPSSKGSGAKLAKLMLEGQFTPQNVNKIMGNLADSPDSPMARLMRGMAHAHSIEDLAKFKKAIESGEVKSNQVSGYVGKIDNYFRQLPKELQDEWIGIVGPNAGQVFEKVIKPLKDTPDKIAEIFPADRIAAFVEKALPHFKVMQKSKKDFEMLKDIMGPVASESSAFHQSTPEILDSPRQKALGTVPKLAKGKQVNEPTAAIIGEAGPEDVVPRDKTVDVGGMRMYDPASLGSNEGPPDDEVHDPQTGQMVKLSRTKPVAAPPADPGSLMRGRGMVRQPGNIPARFGFDDDPNSMPLSMGSGAGQPPGPPPDTTATPPPQEPGKGDQWQRISFTKALSEQYVMDLELIAREGSKFANQLAELNAKGGEVGDAFGEMQKIIHAGNRVNTSYQAQLSRVQRTIEKYQIDEEMGGIFEQFRQGGLSRTEKGTLGGRLTQLKARKEQLAEIGMTQRITPTEYARALRAEQALLDMGGSYTSLASGGMMANMVPTNPAIALSAEIMARSQQNRPMWQQQTQMARRAMQAGKVDRRLVDVQGWYGAIQEGQRGAFAGARQGILDEGIDLASLSGQRQALYETAIPLKQQYEQAMARGDFGGAQRKWDELQPLITKMSDLKDEIGALTPHVKEHVDTLKVQTSSIKEEIQERKAVYQALSGRQDELKRQAADLHGPARLSKFAEVGEVRGEMDRVAGEIKSRATRLGMLQREQRELTDLMHEPQGRQISGLGQRPLTRGQMALGDLIKGYDPQRLFYQFQNMQQLQYMAFMPMLNMRDQYLQQQRSIGQAGYALGSGQMPQSVIENMVSGANVNRAMTNVGKGVNDSLTMRLVYGATDRLADNQGLGAGIGGTAFDLLSGLTALGVGKMTLGPLINSGRSLMAGRGGAGLIGSRLAATGFGEGLATTGGLTGLGVAGAVAGGATAGIAANEMMAGSRWNVGGAGEGGLMAIAGMANPLLPMGIKWARDKVGIGGSGEIGFESLTKYPSAAMNLMGSGSQQPADDGVPVYIKRIESEVARQLGVDKAPFDSDVTAQFARAFAESGGVTEANLEDVTSRQFKDLTRMISESVKAGISPEEFLKFYQAAPEAAGYAPGTEQGYRFQQYVSQGSLFERQQRFEAVRAGANVAGFMGMSPDEQLAYSQQIAGMRASGASDFAVARFQSQRQMGTAYDWSAAAYASGNPQMALFDQAEPWRPKYQREQWAIEDRRRNEDLARDFGTATLGPGGFSWQGGRQQQELDWQRQKLDLEEKFWDFRRKAQDEDFQIQQKLFDFNIKQMRYGMDREEKQAQMQIKYQERQYEISKKIFDLQTKWQREDFDKQEQRMDTQRGWQIQDFAWNRESFELQAGWQQDDMERALRYSSGRERMDIRRQMERAGILAERKRTEMDREEDRATVQFGWAEDDLATQRKRFETLRPLQEEQMALGREYWLEQKQFAEEDRELRKAMIEEQIGLMTEQNNLNVAQYEQQRQLADEQHELERSIAEQKQLWAQQDLELARQRAKEDEMMLGWQREMTEAQQKYSAYTQMGYEWLKKSVPEIEKMARAAQQLADNLSYGSQPVQLPAGIPGANGTTPLPNSSVTMFAEGGPVIRPTFAMMGEQGEEYVVPQNGALVLRGSQNNGEMLASLNQIIALLQSGGGKILIDRDQLQSDGFVHVSDIDQTYH